MNSASDIANLIQINKLLCNFIDEIIVDRSFFYSPFINMLMKRATDLDKNRDELTGLLGGIEWSDEIADKAFLNEWKIGVASQYSMKEDLNTPEFEYALIAALETYKILLNTASAMSFIKRSILLDQKYYLQSFLIDLVKYRELNMSAQKTALSM